jgi:hypothetical protein
MNQRSINLKTAKKITASELQYKNNEGELCDFDLFVNLFVKLPSVETHAPSPQYDFNSKNKTLDNILGYSISYSHSEVEKMFEKINKVCQNKISEFAKSEFIKKCKLKPAFNYIVHF